MEVRKSDGPTDELVVGVAIAFAALLLIIPGSVTDILGFLLIFPVTRKFFWKKFTKKLEKKKNEKNNFIDGDFEDIEDENDKKL